jgi:large subunit ribosomal protein L22
VEGKAKAKYLRSTARKARLVADTVRGRRVGDALVRLEQGSTRHVAVDMAKAVKSAVANLQNKNIESNVNVDELVIRDIRVDGGPVLRRFRARAQGRYGRIIKRMCHISVTVSN